MGLGSPTFSPEFIPMMELHGLESDDKFIDVRALCRSKILKDFITLFIKFAVVNKFKP